MRAREVVSISLPPQIARALRRVQSKEHRSRSAVVQEALRQYLEWKEFKALQRDLSIRARAMGIRTEEDVERLVHEFRGVKD